MRIIFLGLLAVVLIGCTAPLSTLREVTSDKTDCPVNTIMIEGTSVGSGPGKKIDVWTAKCMGETYRCEREDGLDSTVCTVVP